MSTTKQTTLEAATWMDYIRAVWGISPDQAHREHVEPDSVSHDIYPSVAVAAETERVRHRSAWPY